MGVHAWVHALHYLYAHVGLYTCSWTRPRPSVAQIRMTQTTKRKIQIGMTAVGAQETAAQTLAGLCNMHWSRARSPCCKRWDRINFCQLEGRSFDLHPLSYFTCSPHKVPALGSDPVHYDDLYAPPMVFFLFVFWLRRLLAATSKFARLFAAPN
jgi:hypothetical protein